MNKFQPGQAVNVIINGTYLFQFAKTITDVLPNGDGNSFYYSLEGVNDTYHESNLVLETLIDEAKRLGFDSFSDLARAKTTKRHFPRMGYIDLLNQPPRDMLCDFLARGDLGLIFGESGGGKTFVAIDFITACIAGLNFADVTIGEGFSIPKPLYVAYAAGEGKGGLPDRFKAAIDAKGLRENHTCRLSVYDIPQLFLTDEEISMLTFVSELRNNREKTDLLILDTLNNSSTGADENSARDMGKILDSARLAIEALNCAVVIIHHSGKNTSRERGSSALRASMDVMLEVSDGMLICSKLKDGIPFNPRPFEIKSHMDSAIVEWLDAGSAKPKEGNKNRYSEVLALFTREGMELTAGMIAQAIGVSQTNVNNILHKMVENKMLKRDTKNSDNKQSKSNPWIYTKV